MQDQEITSSDEEEEEKEDNEDEGVQEQGNNKEYNALHVACLTIQANPDIQDLFQ